MGSKSDYESRLDRTNSRKSDSFDRRAKENDGARGVKSPVHDGGLLSSKSPRNLKEYNESLSEEITKSSERKESRRERNPLSPRNSHEDKKDNVTSKKKYLNENEEANTSGFSIGKSRKNLDDENSQQTVNDNKQELDHYGRHSRNARSSRLSENRKSPNIIDEFGDDPFPSRSKTPERRKSPRNSRTHSPKGQYEETFTSSSSPGKSRDEVIKPSDGRKSPRRKGSDSDKSRKKMLYEFGTSVDMDDEDDILDNSTHSSTYPSKQEIQKNNFKSSKSSNSLTKSRSFKSPELIEPEGKSTEGRSSKRLSHLSQSPDHEDRLHSKKKSAENTTDTLFAKISDNHVDEDKSEPKKSSKSPVYINELNDILSGKQRKKSKGSNESLVMVGKGDKEKKTEKRRKDSHGNMDDKKTSEKNYEEKNIDKKDDNKKGKNSLNKFKDNKSSDTRKEKSFLRKRSEDNHDENIFDKDNNNNNNDKKDKSSANKLKDKSVEKKEKTLKEKFMDSMKRKSSTSSSSDERRNESENEDHKSKKKDRVEKEPSFSELMASRKKELQQDKAKSNDKDSILSRQGSKSSTRKGDLGKNDEPIKDASEIVDDIFKENTSPKKKPLQRQLHVKSVIERNSETEDGGAKSKSIIEPSGKGNREMRSRSFTEDKEDEHARKDDVADSSSTKLSGATSFDDLSTNKTRNEKTNLSKQRSLSATNISHPSSSPKKNKSLNKSSSSQRLTSSRNDATYTVPTNSADLKEIIYHQWLEKKKVQTKEEIKAKMLAQKRAAKQAEADATERKVTAQKIYDAWNDSKTGKILSEKDMKQKAKQAEKEKIEESLQRKKDAEKYFEAWKREKDDKIKKMISQKKKEEKQKDKEQFNLKRQTSEEALKAFESWKVQKAKEIAEMKRKEEEEKARIGEEKLLAFEKKQEALRVFEQWKSVKKSPRSQSPQLIQRSWLPAGRNLNTTTPDKIQPVIVRNRNVSR